MSVPAIHIEGLHLGLTGKEILNGISLSINRGEFISIIGPNGAGKTSLLKCISRIYTHWSGRISINGRELHHIPQRELARQLSYVPQADGRLFPFTVFEFVLMGRYPHLSPFTSVGAKDRQCVEETMETAGIQALRNRKLNSLSGGERQMAFIAAALAQGADILLLDEPAAFLDYRHQVDVMHLISRLHQERNITVVSVSHDINSACMHSSRVLALRNGRNVFLDIPEKIMTREMLQNLYETPFTVADHPSGRGRVAFTEERS